MNKLRSKKAFTIVEMVIVIAVIAILAAVLIPTVSGVIQKANVSADQQFAASLNIQLALWEVDNGAIKNENDLRNAINHYYGEYNEDGTLKTDYYASFAPKSAKYGYHFWYDVENKIVVLNKYEDLDPTADVSLGFVLFGVAYADEEPAVEPADPAPVVIVFSPESPRSLDIVGKNYFLLDQVGSDVVDQINVIANINGNAEYGQAVALLETAQKDSNLAANLVSRFKTTAIGNNFGVFFYSDWGTKATQVYVAYGVTELGSSKVAEGKYEVAEIYLPDTITLIGTGSLVGFKTVKDDPSTWEGSTTIYVNATVEEITGTNTIVARDSFDCVLEIPTGERFAFVSGVFTNLATNDTYDTEYSVELKSFNVTCVTNQNKKFDLHTYDDGTRTLHYTADIAEDVTLSVAGFIDVNNETANRTAVWTVGDEEIEGNSVTLTKAQLFANEQITVKAQNLQYTIDLVKVAIKDFSASIEEIEGAEPFNPDGDNFVDYYTATLSYRANSSWDVTGSVILYPTLTCVTMSNEIEIALSGSGAGYLVIDGNSFKINSENVPDGTFEAVVTITTKGTDVDGQTISTEYRITFNKASALFGIADNANIKDKYGSQFTFTVGTVQPIELGTLFTLVEGEPENVKVYLESGAGATLTEVVLDKSSGSDWKKWTFTPSSSDNFRISISDGGDKCYLPVNVVSGAYNVANETQWRAVGNNTSICLLKDIVFSDYEESTTYEGAVTSEGKGGYAKQLNGATLHGNLKKITFKKFLIKVATDNRFLYLTNGKVENTIIVGPEYTGRSTSQGNGGPKGYHVHGITIGGDATIVNSYISGFRAPIRTNGGTITIQNSVLYGGTFANIWIWNVVEIKLIDTKLIQMVKSGVPVGAGIEIDTNDTIKKKNVITLTFSGDTQQYAWMNETDDYGDLNSFRNTLLGNSGCNSSSTVFVHTINNIEYVNAGILLEYKDTNLVINPVDYTGPSYCLVADKMSASAVGKSGYVISYTNTACDCKNHSVFPHAGSSYDADIFLAHVKDNIK